MKSISSSIANTLWTQGIIQKEDIDTCRYGLDVFISSVLEIASILTIVTFVENFFETVLFFTAFIPLRVYAGGYHADTKLKCYLISLGVYGIFTVIINELPSGAYLPVTLISTMLSMIMVLIVAPIIHKNKTVNEIERKHYRKFSIWVCSVETVLILLLTAIFSQSSFIVSLTIGQAAVTFSMIAAVIKEILVDNE